MLRSGISANDFFKNNLKNKKSVSPIRTLEDDLNFGLKKEEEILPILNTFFNTTFRNTKDLYDNCMCNYDYESNDGMRVELKSRRNRLNTYETTLIPVHKCVDINLCPNLFIFNFTDGLYFTEWNTNRFNTYETKMIEVKRKNRYENTLHYLIPITDLTKIV